MAACSLFKEIIFLNTRTAGGITSVLEVGYKIPPILCPMRLNILLFLIGMYVLLHLQKLFCHK